MLSQVSGMRFWVVGCAGLALALAGFTASAQSTDPIKIGVIAEESSVAGASLTKPPSWPPTTLTPRVP
jgi:hypothetical protein